MRDIVDGYVTAPGAPTLAYSQAGEGRDLILLHGTLVTREDMILALFDKLAGEFRVTAFDRPGHGDSGRRGPTGTPWRQAADVHAAGAALGLERPVVIGHSFGGATALAYAIQFPEATRGVVALAPIVFPEARLEQALFGPRASALFGSALNMVLSAGLDPFVLPILWRANFLPQQMPARYAAAFPFGKAGSAGQTEAEGEDAAMLNVGLSRSSLNYPSCRTPVRILAGDRDMVVNNALHGKLLARIMPDARFEELPGLGHMLHHFAQEAVAATARELA